MLAHPPSAAYRLKKFVRRHQGQVLAASLVLLALLAGMVGTTWGLIRAEQSAAAERAAAQRERDAKLDAEAKKTLAEKAAQAEQAAKLEAQGQKQKAEEEKAIAVAVKRFLQEKLLGQADVTQQANALLQAGGLAAQAKTNPTIRELLDRAAQELAEGKIEANFPKQPLLQAELLQTVGNTYRGVGELERALGYLQRALALFQAKLGLKHPDTLISMNNLANAYLDAGKRDLALPLYEKTLKHRQVKPGPEHPDTLQSMNNLAAAYWSAKQLDKSIPLFEETLKLQEKKLGRQHPDMQRSVANLGVNYKDADCIQEALPLLEEAFQTAKTNPTIRWVGRPLLDVYSRAGKKAEAAKLVTELLAEARQQLPRASPQLAGELAQDGLALLQAHAFAEAEPLLRECLAIREKTQPERGEEVAGRTGEISGIVSRRPRGVDSCATALWAV